MRLRSLFVIALWASLIAGAMQLLGHVIHDGLALWAVVGIGVVVVGALYRMALALRRRRRRARSWPGPARIELYPAGPRRVLLVETGMVGPR